MNTIRILIVDNHPITLLGIRMALMESYQNKIFNIVGESNDGVSVIEFLSNNVVDIVILDIEMPGMSGLEVAEKIRSIEKIRHVKVLIYTNHNSRVLASDAIARGVDGYLLKDSKTEIIPVAVTRVMSGEFYIDGNLRQRPIPSVLKASELTAMERNIICLILKQNTDKEIASKLRVSVNIVENNKVNIKRKTGSVNIVGIVLYAIEHNLCASIIDLDY